MILTSEVGSPFYAYRLEKQEWKKGETLDGFQFPYNIFDNVHGLFRRFSLWQSSLGVCVPGVEHIPHRRTRNLIWNKTPILVGDQLKDGNGIQTITYSQNIYLRDSLIWRCRVEFGTPPEPQVPNNPPVPQLLEAIQKTNKEFVGAVGTFFEAFLTDVLPGCQVVTQNGPQPVLPVSAHAKLATARKQFEQTMQQYLNKTQESIWL